MTLVRRLVGWASWVLVATVAYAVAWTRLDREYHLALPPEVYDWLFSVIDPTSAERAYDLELWPTAVVGVVVLHSVVWVSSKVVTFTLRSRVNLSAFCVSARNRVLSVIGWSSWLLVSAYAAVVIADECLRVAGIKTRYDPPTFWLKLLMAGLFIGSVHLGARKLIPSVRKTQAG